MEQKVKGYPMSNVREEITDPKAVTQMNEQMFPLLLKKSGLKVQCSLLKLEKANSGQTVGETLNCTSSQSEQAAK